MEGDKHGQLKKNQLVHFNPLPPHGGRPNGRYYPYPKQHFNPLPPHGGRPLGHEAYSCDIQISIHSLRMEGDTTNPWFVSLPFTFQSTPSAWRETIYFYVTWFPVYNFNPLPPHGGRRAYCRVCLQLSSISIHSLRMEGDVDWIIQIGRRWYFNPLPPHGGRLAAVIPKLLL